jgi:hypothetical protein
MACQMAKGLCRAPIEPATMDMHEGLLVPRIFGAAPPPWNAANMVSFVGNPSRRRHVLHDGVKWHSRTCSLKLSFVWFDDGAHCGHRSLIFRTEGMEHRPRSNLVLNHCLHDVLPT